ncbi:MAG TPA: hypothetical protein VFG68_22935 [Fimbriiglobus sp.]|nr:hypothetical protein [Fimbriiglobus sp.]
MFKEQARRLLRTKWQDPQKLAEELFAILSYDGPLTHRGKITIVPDDGEPAIDIQIPGEVPEDPVITLTHPPTTEGGPSDPIGFVSFLPDPDANNTGGGIDSVGGGGNALPDRDDSGNTQTTFQADPRSTPVTTLGRVLNGTGANYTVGVWLDDPVSGTANYWMTVPAKCLQIDSGETIPADSIVYVTLFYPTGRTGVVAYIQPPVVL